MNQRDQNERQNRPGNPQRQGGRYGSMAEAGRDHDEGRGQSRARFTDTYNPEPQWLREEGSERQYGQPLGGGDYDRNDEDYRGGGYASAGRGYGESRGYRSQQGSQYEGSQYGGRHPMEDQDRYRGRQFGQQSYGGYGRGMSEPYEAGTQGSYGGGSARSGGRWDRDEERFAGERGYGQGEYGYRGREYGASRRDMQSGWQQEREGSRFLSGYGGGGYDQASGYGGRDYGSRDYGSRGYGTSGSFATGNYQSGMEGQRSYRGLGPQGYKRSDDRIRDDICERLTDSDRIDASNVTIDVNQGTVTLSGSVPERHMRYAAEDLVDDAMGVESINNQLRVQERSSTTGQASTGVGGRTGSALSEKQTH